MIYNIPSHRRGDTWGGINSITFTVNGSALPLTGAAVKMEFREDIDAPPILTLSTETSSIVIGQAPGVLQIPPKLINIPFGKYQYDLQITFANGVVKTYMSGTWEIVPDITY
jgi:hypothetical protein